jgi:RNA polymerase sigma factor (sigma-70 family)
MWRSGASEAIRFLPIATLPLRFGYASRTLDEAQPVAAEDVPYFRAGEAAIEEIVRKYGRLIRHAIRQAGGRDAASLADDIEQTVIVSLWQQVSREQNIDHPASYIFKAAVRETVRAVRRERAYEERATASDASSGVQQPNPEEIAASRQRREALAAALASLAPDRARAVRAHVGGWSVQEIMELTGWSYQRTRNLIARGMADLRSALVERGAR